MEDLKQRVRQFRARTLQPSVSEWRNVEAESPELAANEFHHAADPGIKSFTHCVTEGEKSTLVKFALIEVEGHEPVVSRLFEQRIWRRAGVRKQDLTLQDIARRLGWSHPAADLLADGWDGEE